MTNVHLLPRLPDVGNDKAWNTIRAISADIKKTNNPQMAQIRDD